MQYRQVPTNAVLYWPSTQLHHLVMHSWASWKWFVLSLVLACLLLILLFLSCLTINALASFSVILWRVCFILLTLLRPVDVLAPHLEFSSQLLPSLLLETFLPELLPPLIELNSGKYKGSWHFPEHHRQINQIQIQIQIHDGSGGRGHPKIWKCCLEVKG